MLARSMPRRNQKSAVQPPYLYVRVPYYQGMTTTRYVVKESRPQAPEMGAYVIRCSKTRANAESFAATWQKKYPKHLVWVEESKIKDP